MATDIETERSAKTQSVKSLLVSDFTVFQNQERFLFSKTLNVLVGENSTGKTHILKLLYCVLSVTADAGRRGSSAQTKTYLQTRIAEKLMNVFLVERLGRLTTRRQGRARTDIELEFINRKMRLGFSFSTGSKSEVMIDGMLDGRLSSIPVYLPTRELLTFVPELIPLYDTRVLAIDEAWRDTCVLLTAPAQRGPKERRIRELLEPVASAMEGQVETDRTGRFFLRTKSGLMEMPLVAEGVRKLAMLARLIATGSLLENGYLLWDEPEANLNPKIIKKLAEAILALSNSGIQVFIATHSLFLLREIEILLARGHYQAIKPRYIALEKQVDGITVRQGTDLEGIGPISSLDEEIQQSDRYLEAVP